MYSLAGNHRQEHVKKKVCQCTDNSQNCKWFITLYQSLGYIWSLIKNSVLYPTVYFLCMYTNKCYAKCYEKELKEANDRCRPNQNIWNLLSLEVYKLVSMWNHVMSACKCFGKLIKKTHTLLTKVLAVIDYNGYNGYMMTCGFGFFFQNMTNYLLSALNQGWILVQINIHD